MGLLYLLPLLIGVHEDFRDVNQPSQQGSDTLI
jgi:hypothetical protein